MNKLPRLEQMITAMIPYNIRKGYETEEPKDRVSFEGCSLRKCKLSVSSTKEG